MFGSSTLLTQDVEARSGDYKLDFKGGTAPSWMEIRVTAKAENGTTYDETFNVDGLTDEQARDLILTDLQGAGWTVSTTGTQTIIITRHGGSEIKQVDIGDNHRGYKTSVSGNVNTSEANPGDKKFKFISALPNAHSHADSAGTLVLSLNSHNIHVALSVDDTPSQVASRLDIALTNAGFVVTRSVDTVILDWEDVTNADSLPVSPLNIEFGLEDGALGPHVAIMLPPPHDVPTLSEWGLIIFALLILTLVTVVVVRHRRAVARAGA